jgi:NAD(P)-dependent dehydrogenase (short-subunit alcohol dehydrogenase family)
MAEIMAEMVTEPKVLGSRLAGKVAIVTGGGSGFGEGIAKLFAEESCRVVVADIDPVGGERVAAYHPRSMYFVKMDVAREEDWENLIENTLDKFGRLDICVNNAGTSHKNKVSGAVPGENGREGIDRAADSRLDSRHWRLLRMNSTRYSV